MPMGNIPATRLHARVAVFPGDIIVGDAKGVVVVPAHLAEQVAAAAAEQEELEDFILARIEGGARIVGNYPPDQATLAEFHDQKRR